MEGQLGWRMVTNAEAAVQMQEVSRLENSGGTVGPGLKEDSSIDISCDRMGPSKTWNLEIN